MTSNAKKRRIIHGLDLATWEAIADKIDVSISTAKRYARRNRDPLPVRKMLGKVRADSDALLEWCERNTTEAA